MKHISTILSVLAIVLVGIFYFVLMREKKPGAVSHRKAVSVDTVPSGTTRVAFFEMDSIEQHCDIVKEVKAEISRQEEKNQGIMAGLDKRLRDKVTYYSKIGEKMSQQEGEAAQRDVMQMQQEMQTTKQKLDNEFGNFMMQRSEDVKKKIADFLKEYNKDKRFTYIFSNESGLFYYRDPAFDITSEIIRGLNEKHQAGKKK